MVNLKDILTVSNVNQMKQSAKTLGFQEIRLYNNSAPHYLGIYATFDDKIDKKEWDSRCLALAYALSTTTGCKIGIISNEVDPEGAMKKEKTEELSQNPTSAFQNLTISKIDDAYQLDLDLYKDYFDKFSENSKSTHHATKP